MKWKIPLFELSYDDRETEAVRKVLDSKWLTSGPFVQQFEDNFAEFLGEGTRCCAVTNCTAALHLSLMALDIHPGDEVIVSGLTFIAAVNMVMMCGATPVLADCKSFEDWNVSPSDIEAKITERTKAIIIVHFAGYPCDMDEIMSIAKKHGIFLIEDVAHAIGADYKGRKCGTFGDISCFSFFSNKNLSTGEGGMLVTKNDELFNKAKLLRSHGMTSLTIDRYEGKTISYDVVVPGLNYRFDEIRASLGIVQLQKLEENNRKRAVLVKQYFRYIDQTLGIEIPWKQLPDWKHSSYHIFPVLLPKNASVQFVVNSLKDEGIQTSIHYPSIGKFTAYRSIFAGSLPVADQISNRVITLPLYPDMQESFVKEISDRLNYCVREVS